MNPLHLNPGQVHTVPVVHIRTFRTLRRTLILLCVCDFYFETQTSAVNKTTSSLWHLKEEISKSSDGATVWLQAELHLFTTCRDLLRTDGLKRFRGSHLCFQDLVPIKSPWEMMENLMCLLLLLSSLMLEAAGTCTHTQACPQSRAHPCTFCTSILWTFIDIMCCQAPWSDP